MLRLSPRTIRLAVSASSFAVLLICRRVTSLSRLADVVNGERNLVFLNIENNSGQNITLLTVAGAFHQADTNSLIRAVSMLFVL